MVMVSDGSAIRRDSDNSFQKLIDHLELHSIKFIRKLQELGASFALIGGMAVSIRTIERFTKDIDLAVAVQTDSEAEQLVLSLSRSGYFVETLLEQENAKRLSTVRMLSRGEVEMFFDLLFASSGIEPEVVATAEEAEIFPGVALKVLSANRQNRVQDIIDLQNLVKEATQDEIQKARLLMQLITDRGYNRNKDLLKEFGGYLVH